MASDLSVNTPQHEIVYESVESLRTQIKEIENKWNDELKRLETARKDKEELEHILRILQTLAEYERAATVKMETMLKETRDVLGIPDEVGRLSTETTYDPSRSSTSGHSSALEFDLVYNPHATPRIPLETPSASSSRPLPEAGDQATTVPPSLSIPTKPASKPKSSPNWKSKIASILINSHNNNSTNPPSPSFNSLNSATPFFDDADSPDPKPKRAAKSKKRPSQDSKDRGAAGWRKTMGSAGSKFANRANRDINRKTRVDLTSILQS